MASLKLWIMRIYSVKSRHFEINNIGSWLRVRIPVLTAGILPIRILLNVLFKCVASWVLCYPFVQCYWIHLSKYESATDR